MRRRVVAHSPVCAPVVVVVLQPDQVVETHVVQVELEVGTVALDIDENGGFDRWNQEGTRDRIGGIDMTGDLKQHLERFRAKPECARKLVVGRPLMTGDKADQPRRQIGGVLLDQRVVHEVVRLRPARRMLPQSGRATYYRPRSRADSGGSSSALLRWRCRRRKASRRALCNERAGCRRSHRLEPSGPPEPLSRSLRRRRTA